MTVSTAILAACCFGGQVLLVDTILDEDRSVLAATAITLVGSTTLLWALTAAFAHPRSLTALTQTPLLLIPFLVAGIADPALTRYLYYEGISRVGPTIAASVTSGSPAVAAILAVILLDEPATPLTATGILLVVTGIAAVQLTASDHHGLRAALADTANHDALFPLAAMTFVAVAFVVVKAGLTRFPNPILATTITQTTACLLIWGVTTASTNARRDVHAFTQRETLLLIISGCIAGAGWYATFTALNTGDVVTVTPIVSAYPVVVVLGASIRKRRLVHRPRTLLAVLVVILGAALARVT